MDFFIGLHPQFTPNQVLPKKKQSFLSEETKKNKKKQWLMHLYVA